MADDTSDSDDLRRRFEEAVSGMELDDLRKLATDIADRRIAQAFERPSLRRPPRDEPAAFRVRVDVKGARPPIWRRLDLRSDLTLDVVHQVLQASFGWWDYHLHRFSLGGGPFDPNSEMFLCPYDVQEGEEDGAPASEVRLDETIQDPGDTLTYLYDYGDNWELTIQLEEILPWEPGTSAAVCVDGRRAAPPEDCGGITDGERLAEVLDDPAHFDVDEINTALQSSYFVLRDRGAPARLLLLLNRLEFSDVGEKATKRSVSLMGPVTNPEPTKEEKAAALKAFQWFLDRTEGDGLELTNAGYLKPVDVVEVSEIVPRMRDWIGKKNREIDSYPLLMFRETLRQFGLVRKYKGTLRRTKAGTKVAGDPNALWHYLARKLTEEKRDRFTDEATLLLLVDAATSTDGSLQLDDVRAMLGELGWMTADHRPLERWDVLHLEPSPLDILLNIGDLPEGRGLHHQISPEAMALARAALLPVHSQP